MHSKVKADEGVGKLLGQCLDHLCWHAFCRRHLFWALSRRGIQTICRNRMKKKGEVENGYIAKKKISQTHVSLIYVRSVRVEGHMLCIERTAVCVGCVVGFLVSAMVFS